MKNQLINIKMCEIDDMQGIKNVCNYLLKAKAYISGL